MRLTEFQRILLLIFLLAGYGLSWYAHIVAYQGGYSQLESHPVYFALAIIFYPLAFILMGFGYSSTPEVPGSCVTPKKYQLDTMRMIRMMPWLFKLWFWPSFLYGFFTALLPLLYPWVLKFFAVSVTLDERGIRRTSGGLGMYTLALATYLIFWKYW